MLPNLNFNCAVRHASPAPKANEDLANAKFYAEIAKAQNAPALGVKVNAIVMLSSIQFVFPYVLCFFCRIPIKFVAQSSPQ